MHGAGVLFNSIMFSTSFLPTRQMVKIKMRHPQIQPYMKTQNTVISEASFFLGGVGRKVSQ